MEFEQYVALRNAKKEYEEMSGYHNGDPSTNGEYHLLKNLAKRISVFGDIGYNHGDTSVYMSTLSREVRIIGFEPNPKLAGLAKHKIFMTALSDEPSKDHAFHIHSTETGVSSLTPRTEFNPTFRDGFSQINVKVARLDDFIDEFNSNEGDLFLKIDVEGYEAKVIRGGGEVFRRHRPIGYFEYANGWLESKEKLRDLFYYMDSIGFACYRITPFGLEHLRFFHFIMENYVYQNIFFCPKGYVEDKFKQVDVPNEFSATKFFLFS